MSTKSYIILKIDESYYIKLFFPMPYADITMFDDMEIYLYTKGEKRIKLFSRSVSEGLADTVMHLEKALQNKTELHSSIVNNNIGYLWNQYLKGETKDVVIVDFDGRESWIGADCLLWSTFETDSWLYTFDSKIFLEITPSYKYHFTDLRRVAKNKTYVPYETWIKSYASVYKIELSKKVAKEWLSIFKKLLKRAQINSRPYIIIPD